MIPIKVREKFAVQCMSMPLHCPVKFIVYCLGTNQMREDNSASLTITSALFSELSVELSQA